MVSLVISPLLTLSRTCDTVSTAWSFKSTAEWMTCSLNYSGFSCTSLIKSLTLAVTSFPFLLLMKTAAAAPDTAPNTIDENFPIRDLLSNNYLLNNFVNRRKADNPAPAVTVLFPAAAAFLLKLRAESFKSETDSERSATAVKSGSIVATF